MYAGEYIKLFHGKSDEVFKASNRNTQAALLLDMEALISPYVLGRAWRPKHGFVNAYGVLMPGGLQS
jgi:hypothetical protein